MSLLDRSQSWTAVALDALWWLRPTVWAGIALVIWFAVITPAQADTFPWPPPNTGCPPNTSCIPGGPPGGGNPGQCTPNPNGNPGCGGAGNPVDIITGNKYQHEIDLAPLPGEMGLHFSRHYNSNSTHRGLSGVGWRSSFEVVLVDLGSAVQIIDADGRRLTFDRQTQLPGVCVGARLEDGRVIVDEGTKETTDRRASTAAAASRGLAYRWQRLDGSEYVFGGGSGDGHPLQSIRAASGATMTLSYLGGALDNVRDAQGRMLRFIYARPLAAGSTRHRMLALSAIDTPVGRVTYRHDEFGRLQSATQPNGLVHRYHYEPERQGAAHNTWALTGISVESIQDGKVVSERLATYVYDAQGRAVRTQHVGSDDLTLAYGPKAVTTITTTAGARTVYRHALVAGQWKTVEGIGPGCATCPAANVRYRYRTEGSQAGQLEATLQLNERGMPLQQERVTFDVWSRPTRIERVGYIYGKVQVPQLVLRAQYEPMPPNVQRTERTAAQYAALWLPRMIARPSIVAGHERSVAVSYNAYLQPALITETGVSPIDATGGFAPTALSRTTTYAFAQIAGASRLTSIDGPLPGNADVSTLHYDEVGRLRLVKQLDDLQQRYAYDEAGRIVWHMPADAVPVHTTFDASGEPSTWQRGEAKVLITRDAFGRPLRIEMPDGEIRWVGHDGPGGLGAMISNRGWGRWQVPTLAAARHLAQFLAAQNLKELPGDNRSRVAATGADPSLSTWGAVDARRDDFGRVVALRNEVTGLEVRSYDEHDRLVERRFADGGIWRYERDAAGRVVAHAVAAPNAETVITRVQWFGAYPIRVEHPNETESRRFDSAGRLSERSIERASGVRFTEHFAYDAADRLTTHALPEGGKLRYAWGIAAQLRAIDYQSPLGGTQSLIAPLSQSNAMVATRPPPATNVALATSNQSGITQQIAGGYRYGNGIEARWQLDAAGKLGALEHRPTEPLNGAQASWWSALLAWMPAAWASNDSAPIAGWRYDYDARGRMAQRSDAITSVVDGFGYDRLGRLVVSEPGSAQTSEATARPTAQGVIPRADVSAREYYAYNARGITLGRRVGSNDEDFRPVGIERSAGGLPQQIGSRTLTYSADRRLIEVQEAGQPLASYRHNAYGERIGKQDALRSATDYLYIRQQLVGETQPDHPERLARRYVYAHGVPVAVIDYPKGQALQSVAEQDAGYVVRATDYAQVLFDRAAGKGPRIAYVHGNEIGAPVAVTDSAQRVHWRAQYRMYGEAQVVAAPTNSALNAYALNLRLPGQYWDMETGWHDNYLRTYDPARGQYLEPDPLGPTAISRASVTQPFSYANHNPLIYADPLGLILFAFDGTGNDESNPSTLSNVVRFRNLYRSDGSSTRYVTGPGTRDLLSGIENPWYRGGNLADSGFSFTGLERVQQMVDYLIDEAESFDNNAAMDIDIIGFSRGAAQARDFANRIVNGTRGGFYSYIRDGISHCQRVNFRFMGLWDTVLSTHVGNYNLAIPDAFASVSHAVALNEYRGLALRDVPGSLGAFPLESIQGRSAPPNATRVERGFLGSHSDIGGGFEQGDLSRVALVWMIAQARAAGVQMDDGPDATIAAAVLHDKSNSLLTGGRPTPLLEDRPVRFADGRTTTQRGMTGTTMTYSDTDQFITYVPERGRSDYVTGTVDLRSYLQWLNARGYGINLSVQ